MPSSTKLEKAELKYNVVFDYPNLELHSAAAAGNVGLVHYALTHGQPVNSVLFGMLPMHAACSGGNTSVVRMLIERGADVNAPRLPLRYSEVKGKGGTAGTSGSTPLHFASANGHANLVKILLASGADPLKPDKNKYTPEALAQAAGHIDCVRVFRAWEHLSTGRGTGLEAGPTVSAEGSRRTSVVEGAEIEQPQSAPVDGSFVGPSVDPDAGSIVVVEEDRPKEKHGGFQPLRFMRNKGKGKAKTDNDEAIEISPTVSPTTTTPRRSATHRLANGPSSSHSSLTARRPSLPSIFEKAAHPGASLRAALHRDRRESDEAFSSRPAPPPAASSFFRGRLRSNETGLTHSRTSSFTESEYQAEGSNNPLAASRQYMSKRSLVGLFKRGGESPQSRSPSPTRPNSVRTGIDPDELEQGLARLQRASLDLGLEDLSINGSTPRFFDTTSMRSTGSDDYYTVPNSPQPSYLSQDPFAGTQRRVRSHSGASEGDRPRDYGTINTSHRPRSAGLSGERPRTGSEVASPSPLALEWAPGQIPQRPKLSPVSTYSNSPRTRGHTKKRSATMPSGFSNGVGWDDGVDLRKVASGVFRRESEKLLRTDGISPESPVDVDAGVELPLPVQSPVDGAVDVVELDGALAAVADGEELRKPLIIATEPTPTSVSPPQRSPISPTRSNGRDRGRSISSMTSTTSAFATSFGQTSLATESTPPSSTTAAFHGSSANSLVSGFPPVPEHCTPGGSIEGSSFPFLDASMRKVSSHAEARDLKLQSEREVLQAALLPPSHDSSLSLSQQLAAYGDSYILERELAEVERRKDRSRSEVNTLNSASSGPSVSGGSNGRRAAKEPTLGFGEHRSQRQRSPAKPERLITQASAPDTTQLTINRIYDARAAAYRDRAKALTTAPAALQNYAKAQRARRGTATADTWLTAGPARSPTKAERHPSDEHDHNTSTSAPLPVTSLADEEPSRKYSTVNAAPRKPSLPPQLAAGTVASGSKPSFPPSSRSVSRPIRTASASTTGSAKLGSSVSPYMAPPTSWAARSPFGGGTASQDNSDSSDSGFQRRRERVKIPAPTYVQPETATNKSKWGIKGMMEQLGRRPGV